MFSRVLKRWEISASTGSHFDVLDGLRGVAILLVIMLHGFYANPERGLFGRLASYFILGGWVGVPIFFVLSGFLISFPFFQKRQHDPHYWHQHGYFRRRIGKILPPFYLSIMLSVIFFWFLENNSGYVKSGLIWATGLGNFILTKPSFNEYYWSLLVETHFYIVLPLLMWLFRGLHVRRLAIMLFLVLFLVPLISRCLTWPAGVYLFDGSNREFWLAIKRFPTQLDYFAWGVLLAGIFTDLNPVLTKLKALSGLGYCGVVLLAASMLFWGAWVAEFDLLRFPTHWSDEIRHLLPAFATFLMLFFIFDPSCLGARVLSTGWLRFTGIISYEWFLFHSLFFNWWSLNHNEHTDGNILAYIWKTFVPVVMSFIFSAMIYRFFSRPVLNHIRNKAKAVKT